MRQIKIAPSIVSADLAHLADQVRQCEEATCTDRPSWSVRLGAEWGGGGLVKAALAEAKQRLEPGE